MNKIDKVTIMSDTFENEESGETVQGITIIIDGKLKQVMDVLINNNLNYSNYTEVVKESFFRGLNEIVTEHNGKKN